MGRTQPREYFTHDGKPVVKKRSANRNDLRKLGALRNIGIDELLLSLQADEERGLRVSNSNGAQLSPLRGFDAKRAAADVTDVGEVGDGWNVIAYGTNTAGHPIGLYEEIGPQ